MVSEGSVTGQTGREEEYTVGYSSPAVRSIPQY